mgnify:CR=1 FL=1
METIIKALTDSINYISLPNNPNYTEDVKAVHHDNVKAKAANLNVKSVFDLKNSIVLVILRYNYL